MNLRIAPGRLLFGWFAAAAVVSLVLLAATAFFPGVPESDSDPMLVVLAMGLGFLAGGIVVGWGGAAPPIAAGLWMAAISVLVWAGANLFFGEATDSTTWSALNPLILVALLVLQAAMAALGVRLSNRNVATASVEL